MSENKEIKLGVLGGVGPLATIYFAELVIRCTDAATDQEHVSMIILNHAAIHDRTNYILDRNEPIDRWPFCRGKRAGCSWKHKFHHVLRSRSCNRFDHRFWRCDLPNLWGKKQ